MPPTREPRDLYYSRDRERDRQYQRERKRDYDERTFEFRDHERDEYERERDRELDREREMERERYVESSWSAQRNRFTSVRPHVRPAARPRSLIQRLEYQAPMSFEQALTMGRTGRVLPSPVLNGFKPKMHARHSDSDEEDWC